MTSETAEPHDVLMARFFYKPETVTDEQLSDMEHYYNGPWLRDDCALIVRDGLRLRHLHRLIVNEQERRKKAKEGCEIKTETAVPLNELVALLKEMPGELTDAQLAFLGRSYDRNWQQPITGMILAEKERRKKQSEEEMLARVIDLATRLAQAPIMLSALDLNEIESGSLPFDSLVREHAKQERERREARSKKAFKMSDGGEAVGLVAIGGITFAVIPEYNNDAMHAVLNLDRATVGHVFTVDGRSVCQTCQRADCVHAEAVKRLLKRAGGDHASV